MIDLSFFASCDTKGWTQADQPDGWVEVRDETGKILGWCFVSPSLYQGTTHLSGYVLPATEGRFAAYRAFKGSSLSCRCLGQRSALLDAKKLVYGAILSQMTRPTRRCLPHRG